MKYFIVFVEILGSDVMKKIKLRLWMMMYGILTLRYITYIAISLLILYKC